MVERVSALAGHYETGRFGAEREPGVTLSEMRGLVLHQVAAWPDTLASVGDEAARAAGLEAAPGPCRAASGDPGALLRVAPLKWWVFGTAPPELTAEQGATLELSHSWTHVRIGGPEATTVINRHLPLDLGAASFPVGSVGSSAFHHVGVTLWHSQDGYEFFLPRGFSLSLWEMLLESAAQFGVEVT